MMVGGLMLLPMLLMFLAGMCAFVFWVWSLVDCLTRPDDSLEPAFGTISPKLVWALIIFFTGVIGTIIYLFVAGTKKSPKRTVVQARAAGTDESRRILEMVGSGKISAAEGQRLLAALETREQQVATAQMRSSTPRVVWIGCLLLLILPVLLVLGILFGLFAARRHAQNRAMQSQRIQMQVEQQLRGKLGNGLTMTTSGGVQSPSAANAQMASCSSQLSQLCSAVQMFESHNGHLPASLTELTGSSTNAAALAFVDGKGLLDPWGRIVRYRQVESGFEVRSAGADGKFDTADDLAQVVSKASTP